MDATFRIALIISTIMHSAIFVPAAFRSAIEPDKPVVVDYVRIKAPELKVAGEQNRPLPKPAGSTKVELAKKVNLKEARELAKSQAPLKAKKDYINYYQLIREKIRQRLKERYSRVCGEGDVAVVFILNSSGSLSAVEIEEAKSTRDSNLGQIAVASVKDAAPFPPFPGELPVAKMSFDLTVSFKKD